MRDICRTPHVLVPGIAFLLLGCGSGHRAAGEAQAAEKKTRDAALLTDLAKAPEVRRMWSGRDVYLQTLPSPDGRLLAFADGRTGHIVIRDIAAGKTVSITGSAKFPEGGEAWSPQFSPDQKLVAFGWMNHDTDRGELRVVSITKPDSGRIRVVALAPTGVRFISPHAWAPGGATIIASLSRDAGGIELIEVDASNGHIRSIRRIVGQTMPHLSVSPDGKWIAYDLPSGDNGLWVEVVRVDGSGSRRVTEGQVIGWTPDGRRLLVGSTQGGVPQIVAH